MPFADPKSFDDSIHETASYAERRDEIGRGPPAGLTLEKHRLADPRPITSVNLLDRFIERSP